MKQRRLIASSALMLMASLSTHAATNGYVATWDTTLEGWDKNTDQAVVTNAGGYLQSSRAADGFMPIGIKTEVSFATGNFYGQVWTAEVDLKVLEGTPLNAYLRFRYLDSTKNGWIYLLTNEPKTSWTHYAVSFDTSWTDAQAASNGWAQEPTSASWLETMAHVYTAEIRVNAAAFESVAIGIDNFSLRTSTPAVPEPS